MHRFFLPVLAAALAGAAEAQIVLQANPAPANNGGAVNWGMFFDLTAGTSAVTVTELRTASSAAAGAPLEFEVLTFVGSGLGGPVASGPGSDPTGWTSLGTASGTQGPLGTADISDSIDIPDILVPAGQTVGVCLRFTVAGPRYKTGTLGTYNTFADANLTLTTGEVRSTPFLPSGSYFFPRELVGELTYVLGSGGGVGTAYCGPAVANSTGSSATIAGTGSAIAANNNLGLTASDLPLNAFGFFLASRTQGVVNQPGGSQGVLCLGGQIGRYVGPGQIKNSGATGSFSLAIDNTQLPTPTGPVAGAVGETWNFQAWYRDAVGGTATSNFTNGLAVTWL